MLASIGAVWAVIGEMSQDQLLTWAGVIIAAGSALGSAVLAGYGKFRDRMREADRLDRAAAMEDIRALTRVQTELDARIARTEAALLALEAEYEKGRCRLPLPDGSARCAGPGDIPTEKS